MLLENVLWSVRRNTLSHHFFLPATPPDPRIFVPTGSFNLLFPPNESVTTGTSIDWNRCVSVLRGKLDANNQGHQKKAVVASPWKFMRACRQGLKWNPKQENSWVYFSAERSNACMLLLISINTGNCPIKKTQEGLRSANYFAVFQHHTYQILKADGAARFVTPSPGPESSG